jgi:hypothetical protein
MVNKRNHPQMAARFRLVNYDILFTQSHMRYIMVLQNVTSWDIILCILCILYIIYIIYMIYSILYIYYLYYIYDIYYVYTIYTYYIYI